MRVADAADECGECLFCLRGRIGERRNGRFRWVHRVDVARISVRRSTFEVVDVLEDDSDSDGAINVLDHFAEAFLCGLGRRRADRDIERLPEGSNAAGGDFHNAIIARRIRRPRAERLSENKRRRYAKEAPPLRRRSAARAEGLVRTLAERRRQATVDLHSLWRREPGSSPLSRGANVGERAAVFLDRARLSF